MNETTLSKKQIEQIKIREKEFQKIESEEEKEQEKEIKKAMRETRKEEKHKQIISQSGVTILQPEDVNTHMNYIMEDVNNYKPVKTKNNLFVYMSNIPIGGMLILEDMEHRNKIHPIAKQLKIKVSMRRSATRLYVKREK